MKDSNKTHTLKITPILIWAVIVFIGGFFSFHVFHSAADQKLNAYPGKGYVMLYWTSDESAEIFTVYAGYQTGGPYYQLGKVKTQKPVVAYWDVSQKSGSTVFYVVDAINKRGREYQYTEETRLVIP